MRRETNVFVARQVLLEVAVCLISFTFGMAVEFSSILNPAILSTDSDIKVTPDQASWIATFLGMGGIVGYFLMPTIFEIFGRKSVSIVTNLFILIGSLMLFVASDIYSLVFARFTQGMTIAGTFMSIMALCECISPKRRGYFMVINKIALDSGSVACHVLGFILNWRQIALFSASWNVISIIFYYISPESPAYLAMLGQFDKCAKNFECYRGDSLNAKTELNELILSQSEILKINEGNNNSSIFKRTKNILMTKGFQKSYCILTLTTLCLATCGRYYLLAYITQIVIESTNNNLAFYMCVSSDFVLLFALAISTILVKHFKRRTLLFKSGFCSVIVMFMVSFSIILRSKLNVFQDMEWLIPTVILLHTFVTNIGLIPIIFALSGEVFSLDQKGLGTFMSGILCFLFFNVIMKLTPLMIDKIGVEGTYSIYGLLLFILLLLLRIILPETKDKTLQQIENEIKGIVRNKSNPETKLLNHTKEMNC